MKEKKKKKKRNKEKNKIKRAKRMYIFEKERKTYKIQNTENEK